MLLCKPLDFARHSIDLQVSMVVIVSNVPGCIDHVSEYFVLELYNVYITLFGATPRVRYLMSKRVLGFVCIKEVCYEGTVRSSFLPANTFFICLFETVCFICKVIRYCAGGLEIALAMSVIVFSIVDIFISVVV